MVRTVLRSLLCVSLLVSMAHAAIPLINSATVNYANNTLTVSGTGFGSNPKVTLASMALTMQTSTATQIVAVFPSSASGLAPGSYVLTVAFSNQFPALFLVALGAPESDVATLKQQVTVLQFAVAALQASNSQLQAQLSAVASNSVLALNGKLNLEPDGTTVQFSGVNVQIVNGMGSTETTNGTGNLIVGYNEVNPCADVNCTGPYGPADKAPLTVCSDGTYLNQASCTANGGVWADNQRTGSHNLVIGAWHGYTQYGGMVVGFNNAINRRYANVSGGNVNVASGQYSSVSGGEQNSASGLYSSVSGGFVNNASGAGSSVSGGQQNSASGVYSSVSGGFVNNASGAGSSVSGGADNNAGVSSSVSGGQGNSAGGGYSSVSGGTNNTANTYGSSVSGGQGNSASGGWSSVSGGANRTAPSQDNWAAGNLSSPN